MRLICPNCDAEYEVDDSAIPDSGRDVQCSSCGHGWFQTRPLARQADPAPEWAPEAMPDLPEDEAEDAPGLDGDLPPAELPGAEAAAQEWSPRSEAPVAGAAEVIPGAGATAAAAIPPPAETPRRSIDESVLAVLREEAEREAAARRGERLRIETQTEMPLSQGPKGAAAVALTRPEARTAGSDAPTAAPARPVETFPEAPRKRTLLPEIEEIKSSLHPSSEPEEEGQPGVLPDPRKGDGFRAGFVYTVLVAVILVAIYVTAPLIAEKVPALRGPLETYVVAVNRARVALNGQIQALIQWLHGMAGGSAS